MNILRQSTAVDVLIGPFVDSTDGVTAETALTLSQADITLSKNGQTLAQKNDITAAAHDANGYYNCELDATDTNTIGTLVLTVNESGALPVRHEFQVVEENVYDMLFADGGDLGTTVDAILTDTAEIGAAGAGLTALATQASVNTIDTNVDAILDDTGTSGVVVAAGSKTGYELSGTLTTLDDLMLDVGTAQGGTSTSITLRSGASASDFYYADAWVFIVSGTGAGQSRLITNYTGSSKVADVSAGWTTNPNSTSVYAIFPAGLVNVGLWNYGNPPGVNASNHMLVDVRAINNDTGAPANLEAAYDGTGYAGGTIKQQVSTVELTAAALADMFNTDSGTTYASAVAGSVVKETADNAGGSSLTVGDIADAVWDEPKAGHVTAGTFGEEVQAHALSSEISALNDLSAAEVNAEVDTALADYDGPTKAEMDTAFDTIMDDGTATFDRTTDSLQAIRDRGDAAWTGGGSAPSAADIRAEIDANSTQLAAIVADTNELQTDWANGGRLDLIIDAILADTNELQSDDYPTTLAAMDAKLDTIDNFLDTEIAAILEDTGTTIPGLIAALNDLDSTAVQTAAAAALTAYDPPTKAELDSGLSGLNDLSAAEVNAQVVDALNVDTYAEPSSVPAATASIVAKIGWLYILSRNKITQTATTQTLRNDADSGNVGTASVSDDGTTATRSEWS